MQMSLYKNYQQIGYKFCIGATIKVEQINHDESCVKQKNKQNAAV